MNLQDLAKYLKIDDEAAAKGAMWFLAKERFRHAEDIKKIDKDMERLAIRWGLPYPKIVRDMWVDV